MAEATARQIADTIICLCRRRGIEVSNLKLQKLAYYSQAWYLAFVNRALFDEEIEAWVHGPVVYRLFSDFKQYRWRPIDVDVQPVESSDICAFVEKIIDTYGALTPTHLERMTHVEKPWKDARAGLPADVPSRAVISKESMREFYSRFLTSAATS